MGVLARTDKTEIHTGSALHMRNLAAKQRKSPEGADFE